jgi:BlaI family transcriptional regulator, penicillinase repressor
MRQEAAASPTERELEILKILWELGTASVRQVFDVMRAKEDIAQNTVQTFLRMMEEKGLVEHVAEGRTFIYTPLYSREKTVSRFLDRVFDGAVQELVMNAISVKKLSTEELDSLERLIQDAKKVARK